MTTREQLDEILSPEEQNELLVAAVLAAAKRYSLVSEQFRNFEKVKAKERSGELSLMDRLMDCLPTGNGHEWLTCELWDHRDSLFEAAWGDSEEELLAAIMGPPSLDENHALSLEDSIKDKFEWAVVPAWSDRKAPKLSVLVDFISDWRHAVLTRLSRRLRLDGEGVGDRSSS